MIIIITTINGENNRVEKKINMAFALWRCRILKSIVLKIGWESVNLKNDHDLHTIDDDVCFSLCSLLVGLWILIIEKRNDVELKNLIEKV